MILLIKHLHRRKYRFFLCGILPYRKITAPGYFDSSPLSDGLFAAGKWSFTTILLILAALSAFMIRQPITIAVKAYSGRRDGE